MVSRAQERLGGLLIAGMGGGLAGYNWHLVRTAGIYYMKASFGGAAFLVVGVALVFFPSPRTERVAKGLPQQVGPQQITPTWWAVLVVAILAGLVNIYWIGRGG